MRAKMVAAVMLAAFPGWAFAAAKRDPPTHVGLKCTGTQKSFGAKPAENQWERTFSLDLSASKGWVVGAAGQFDIVATDTRITFWDGYEIDRTTGHLSGRDNNKYIPTLTSAECEKTTYTPIPDKKF